MQIAMEERSPVVQHEYHESEKGINGDEFPEDRPPIRNSKELQREWWAEWKKLWKLAGPAIFTSICQYSLGAITQTFAGHLSTLDLAAVSIENSVIAGLSFGIMLGMGSALQTLCGQAFGAGRVEMLGVYMQRSWIILNTSGVFMSLVYVFATPILKLLGQSDEIAELAGTFSLWMIPQLFAYAMVFPTSKFLQAQSKVMVMAVIAAGALIVHVLFSWVLMFKLGWGLVGGAVMLNLSWWIIVVSQLIYIFTGACKGAWTGFSWSAFNHLPSFLRLSIASGLMLCSTACKCNSLEFWYTMILTLLAGHLKNPQIAVDSMSICINLLGWVFMIANGFNVGISVRVSNELGGGRPKAAKFAVTVVFVTSMVVGIALMGIILVTRNEFAVAFTNSKEVAKVVSGLATLLGLTMLLDSVQPVLSGVAVGAGWQGLVAYVNMGCYYLFGLPLGFLLGYTFNLGLKPIGMNVDPRQPWQHPYFFLSPLLIQNQDGSVELLDVNKDCSHKQRLVEIGDRLSILANLDVATLSQKSSQEHSPPGIWIGMISGIALQMLVLCIITHRTKWNVEASRASNRIKVWGGVNYLPPQPST
eukprot:Gb_40010 [translate_table: standard]